MESDSFGVVGVYGLLIPNSVCLSFGSFVFWRLDYLFFFFFFASGNGCVLVSAPNSLKCVTSDVVHEVNSP